MSWNEISTPIYRDVKPDREEPEAKEDLKQRSACLKCRVQFKDQSTVEDHLKANHIEQPAIRLERLIPAEFPELFPNRPSPIKIKLKKLAQSCWCHQSGELTEAPKKPRKKREKKQDQELAKKKQPAKKTINKKPQLLTVDGGQAPERKKSTEVSSKSKKIQNKVKGQPALGKESTEFSSVSTKLQQEILIRETVAVKGTNNPRMEKEEGSTQGQEAQAPPPKRVTPKPKIEIKPDPDAVVHSDMRDEDSTGDSGVASPPLDSPTPSETLRPEGFMPASPVQGLENGNCSPMSGISEATTQGAPESVEALHSGRTATEEEEEGEDEEEEESRAEVGGSEGGEGKTGKEDEEEEDEEEEEEVERVNKGEKEGVGAPHITVRPSAELMAPPPPEPPVGAADTFSALQGLVSDVASRDGLKVVSPVELGLVNGAGGLVEEARCDVCHETVAGGRVALENHRAAAGHYRCDLSPDCVTVLPSAAELAHHQTTAHAMHHLAQQVQRLGASPSGFQPQAQQPPGGMTMITPQMQQFMAVQQQQMQHQQMQQQQMQQQAAVMRSQPQSSYQTPAQNRQVFIGSPPPPPSSYGYYPPGTQQLGGGAVVMTPAMPSQLPNLPGVQVSKRPAPHPPQSQTPPKQRREEPPSISPQMRLPDSITLVRPGQQSGNISSNNISNQLSIKPRNDPSSSVADMLATRGITVVPSSGRNGTNNGGNNTSITMRRNPAPQTCNLNSAVSITPSSGGRASGMSGGQAQGRGRGGVNASTRGCPTVDLTVEVPPPLPPPRPSPGAPPPGHRAPRSMARARVTCQVCDKIFASPDALTTHMQTHRQPNQPQLRSPAKLPFECNLCTAQYPSSQGLASHKQKYHGESAGADSAEMVIPVVNLKVPGCSQRLASLGVRHFIPLAQLHNQSGGLFGLPIVPIDSVPNPALCNIGGIGASNLFPLGPLKSLR